MKSQVHFTACFVLVAAASQACSARNIHLVISKAHDTAWGAGFSEVAVALVAFALTFFLKNRWFLVAQVGLLALHPVWWMSTSRGDCGQGLVNTSGMWFALSICLLAKQMWDLGSKLIGPARHSPPR